MVSICKKNGLFMQHYDNNNLRKQQGIALIIVLIYSLLASIIVILILELSLHNQKQVENSINMRQMQQINETALLALENKVMLMEPKDLIHNNVSLLAVIDCMVWQQAFWQVNYYQIKIYNNGSLFLESIVAKPIEINLDCRAATQVLQQSGRQSWRLLSQIL